MTASSDGAQPNPGDQQQPDPAAVTPAAQQQPEPQDDQPVDIDQKALDDAKAAAEAEKAAAAGGGDGKTVDPADPAGQQAKPGEQGDQGKPQGGQQPAGDQPMIPKARFDEALNQRDKAVEEAAYLKGRLDALTPAQPLVNGQQQGGGQQQQQPTSEQRLTEIQQAQDALATRFDNGEITYAELTKQQRELANREFAIREELLVAKVKPAADPRPADANSDQLYLETLTAELEQAHPMVPVLDKVGTDKDWNYLRDRAIDNLVARGIDPTKGAMGRYELRKEVAALADQLGPALVGDRAKAQGIALPGQTPSQGGQQQPKPLSPQAQARASKLALAADAPPNVSQMGGTAGDPGGMPTDTAIEAMDEEAIGRLPDTTRKRLLGVT